MKVPGLALLQTEMRRYLRNKTTLISPEIIEVLADVNRFTSAILRNGFRSTLGQLLGGSTPPLDRPFLEVCTTIVEHHIQFVEEGQRKVVGKSLFEAYMYFAGLQQVFEPAHKTRLIQSLRRRGVKGFASLFLSLHLFNVLCMEIQEQVRAKAPDLKSFELDMLGMEAICRDTVTRAMRIPDGDLDERWAATIRSEIETQLLTIS